MTAYSVAYYLTTKLHSKFSRGFLMNTKQRRRTFFISLICLLTLIGSVANAKTLEGNVVFTRFGMAVEFEDGVSTKKLTALEVNAESRAARIENRHALKPRVLAIDDRRFLIQFAWEPYMTYRIKALCADGSRFEASMTAPLKPSAYPIRTIELRDLLSLTENLQKPAAPTSVAFSPDSEKLAIATDAGHLAIINPLTGEKIWKTRISESYTKHTVFSPDGRRLYIGEQSADGFVYAYELSGRKPTLLWKYRMADDIDTSTPFNPNDVYAWVQYPGPYRIAIGGSGDLLVAGVHSWTQDGAALKKSQLYRFDGETGELKWKWPSDQPLPMIIRWFDYSRDGQSIALVYDTSGSGASPQFQPGSLCVIDGVSGTKRWEYAFEPLKPYFEAAKFWRGVGVSPDGRFINVTTEDGRAFIFDTMNAAHEKVEPLWQTELATPLEVSDIPITATSGTIAATNTFALFVTGDTFIPYHLQKGAQQPPAAHPNGMTLFAYKWTGEKAWQWALQNMPQGLRVDASARYAAVSISKASRNHEEQLHGVSVFDLAANGGGLAKYLYTYRVEGQLPYDTIGISADGQFIAFIETPIVKSDETTRGKNRVHIIQ